jgi:hypothetical protein
MRGARCLALPHVPPARCVSIVELTSCVGHERQEGDHGRQRTSKGLCVGSRRPRRTAANSPRRTGNSFREF